MKIEEVIGYWITQAREDTGLKQAQIGEQLAEHLGKPWSRQAVWAAEKGNRSFTAAELVALAKILGGTVESLLEPPPGVDTVELGTGTALDARHLRATAATNSDLAGLADAVQRMRDAFPGIQEDVDRLDTLIREVARETWTAVRGRGIDVVEEQGRKLVSPDRRAEP